MLQRRISNPAWSLANLGVQAALTHIMLLRAAPRVPRILVETVAVRP